MNQPDDFLNPRPRNAYERWKAELNGGRLLGAAPAMAGGKYQVVIRAEDIPHGTSVVVAAGRVQQVELTLSTANREEAPELLTPLRGTLPPEFALAAEELDEAAQFLAAAVRANGFEQFRKAWKHYLLSLGRTHAKTIRLAKHGAGKDWARAEQQVHVADPLLYYLREARNEAEHGVAETILRGTDGLGFGPAPGTGGLLPNIMMGSGVLVIEGSSGTCPLLITRTAWRPLLCQVTNKKQVTVPLPYSHLGQAVNAEDPIAVGRLGLSYHRKALLAASGGPAD